MTESSQPDFSRLPVEAVARLLSVCGNEDPTLLRRATAPEQAIPTPETEAPWARRARPATPPPLDQESYLEDLVSIALASARQAEEAARQVHHASIAARRRMYALSIFGALGILVGVASIASGRLTPAPGPVHSGVVTAATGSGVVTAFSTTTSPVATRLPELVVQHSPPPALEPPPMLTQAEQPAPTTMPTAEPLPVVDVPAEEVHAVPDPESSQAALETERPAGERLSQSNQVTPPAQPRAVPVRQEPPARLPAARQATAAIPVAAGPTAAQSQLMAAVQALEALTQERMATRADGAAHTNNRM